MLSLLFLIAAVFASEKVKMEDIRIYEIQVASYFSGDKNIGFENSWGPSSDVTNWGGDLKGIIDNIPNIAELGYNALWLTPIFNTKYTEDQKEKSNICENHSSCGYFIADYYDIDPHFGTKEVFQQLIETAHNNGIYVFLDGVFGHIKPTICGTGVPVDPEGKSPKCFEDTCSETSGDSKMDYNQQDTKDFFIKVAKHWITEYNIDGWRLDAPYELTTVLKNADKTNLKEVRENNLVHEFKKAIVEAADANKAAGKEWGILGYVITDDKELETVDEIVAWYGPENKKTADTWYDWPSVKKFRDTFLEVLEGKKAVSYQGIIDTIGNVNKYPSWSHPIFCSSNHDFQRLGNSIRNKTELTPDDQKYWDIHLAFQMYQFLYPGLISTYYGEETGEFIDCYRYGGNCGAYDDNAGRTNPTPEDSLSEKQKAHRDNIKKLINWRKSHGVVTCRNCKTTAETKSDMLVVTRLNEGKVANDIGGFIYIANLNNAPKKITLNVKGGLKNVLTDAAVDGTKEFEVPARSSLLIEGDNTMEVIENADEGDNSATQGGDAADDNSKSESGNGTVMSMILLSLFFIFLLF